MSIVSMDILKSKSEIMSESVACCIHVLELDF